MSVDSKFVSHWERDWAPVTRPRIMPIQSQHSLQGHGAKENYAPRKQSKFKREWRQGRESSLKIMRFHWKRTNTSHVRGDSAKKERESYYRVVRNRTKLVTGWIQVSYSSRCKQKEFKWVQRAQLCPQPYGGPGSAVSWLCKFYSGRRKRTTLTVHVEKNRPQLLRGRGMARKENQVQSYLSGSNTRTYTRTTSTPD